MESVTEITGIIEGIRRLRQRCTVQDELGQPFNLTPREISVLLAVRPEERVGCHELAVRVGLSDSRGSRITASLIEKGYLLRGESGEDRRLEEAINRAAILKVYPGMRGELPVQLMEAGVRDFILELYDSGTANLRESPYSLRRAFLEGRERGARFFCTSQQEGVVDFSEYLTSHELWREGAIPMGSLTTESAFTRLITARLTCRGAEDGEELVRIMEEANAELDR